MTVSLIDCIAANAQYMLTGLKGASRTFNIEGANAIPGDLIDSLNRILNCVSDIKKRDHPPIDLMSKAKSLEGYLQALEPGKPVMHGYLNRLWDHYMPNLFLAIAAMEREE